MRVTRKSAEVNDRVPFEQLFLTVQRERIALTTAIMRLRDETPMRRPRRVVKIIIALLRLQRANRRAMAAFKIKLPG